MGFIRVFLVFLVFLMSFQIGAQTDNQIKIDNGLTLNVFGLSTSTQLRYKTPSIDYRETIQIMGGISYSHFIGHHNTNHYQYGGSLGVFLNREVSLELESIYMVNQSNISTNYYNIGFRFYTPYKMVYELKLGTKLIQLGIAYSVNFNLNRK